MSDLVGHHTVDASVRLDPGAPEPRLDVSYAYGGLPLTLSERFTRNTQPRNTGFRVSDQDVPFDETSTSLTTSIGLPIQHPVVSQALSLAYTATFYAQRLRLPTHLDPVGTITVKPDDGFLSQLRFSYGLSTTEGAVDAAGTKRGVTLRVGTSVADPSTGSDQSLYTFDASASAYIPMPWPGEQTVALRAAGAVSAGTYARRGIYLVGGYDLENNSIIDTILSSTFDGTFALRGFLPSAYGGSEYLLGTLEYRAPLFRPNWGPSTVPLFLRRVDAAAFADWGGAFDELGVRDLKFLHSGELVYLPGMHTSVGLEVWLGLSVFYRIDMNLKVGYAYGFADQAVPGGQLYFISSSAF
jgi:outer membrane protein assembly factor BamA